MSADRLKAYQTYEHMRDMMLDQQQYRAYLSPATVEMVIYLVQEIEKLKEKLAKLENDGK